MELSSRKGGHQELGSRPKDVSDQHDRHYVDHHGGQPGDEAGVVTLEGQVPVRMHREGVRLSFIRWTGDFLMVGLGDHNDEDYDLGAGRGR